MKVLRKVGIVFLCFFVLGGLINIVKGNFQAIIIMIPVCILLYISIKKDNTSSKSNVKVNKNDHATYIPLNKYDSAMGDLQIEVSAEMIYDDGKKHEKYYVETPPEIERDMKKFVNKATISTTLQILEDCRKVVRSTKNIETALMRLDLGAREGYNLKQLEQAKFYKAKPTATNYLDFFIGEREGLIKECILRSYIDMMEKAIELKTEKGKINKINKFFEDTLKHFNEYDDEIIEYINKLKKRSFK